MSSACWCGKGSLPLALMKSAFGFVAHHRTALIPAPTVYRASKPCPLVHITPWSPLDLASPCSETAELPASLDHRLRRDGGPERPGGAVEADGRQTPEPADAVMSGRRPLSRGFLKFSERLGCGHVFGLLVQERFAPAGPDEVRFWLFAPSPYRAYTSADSIPGFQALSVGSHHPVVTPRPLFALRRNC